MSETIKEVVKEHPLTTRWGIVLTSISTAVLLTAGALIMKSESSDSKERNDEQDERLNKQDVINAENSVLLKDIHDWVTDQKKAQQDEFERLRRK